MKTSGQSIPLDSQFLLLVCQKHQLAVFHRFSSNEIEHSKFNNWHPVEENIWTYESRLPES